MMTRLVVPSQTILNLFHLALFYDLLHSGMMILNYLPYSLKFLIITISADGGDPNPDALNISLMKFMIIDQIV